MLELMRFVDVHLPFLVDDLGFTVVSTTGESRGASVRFESDELSVRLTSDRQRNETELMFHPHGLSNEWWFSPDVLAGLLHGERGGSGLMTPARARELATTLPELLRRLRDTELREPTIEGLKAQQRRRSGEW